MRATLYFGEIVKVKENEEYVEVTVIYEIQEKIGTEEKIQFQDKPKRKDIVWKRKV